MQRYNLYFFFVILELHTIKCQTYKYNLLYKLFVLQLN